MQRSGCASSGRVSDVGDGGLQHGLVGVGRTLLEFCRDREDDALRFTTDTRIWPTNNISERSLRPTKTQQKISGRLTSEEITQDRLDIRSYIDTIRKHRADVLTGIRNALTGDPWRPPIPTPT